MSPKRVQLKRSKGWRKPEGVRSVVRGTDYGNPFKVGNTVEMRDDQGWTGMTVEITRELAVALFRADLDANPGWKAQAAGELRDKDLGCYCPLDQPCHADVWLELANGAES